ncbi:MAG: hypothetical protein EHM47_19120 [Ignavibacteriales bacterium]|nr:MAG: hypothetical protein EHM47_19120 [Ignavibacteriales bacterium]
MKPLISFILFTFFSFSLHAQCAWEKNNKYPFNGTISRSTPWETITRTFFSSISFQIVEYQQDSSMHLNVKVDVNLRHIPKRCFDDKSKIMLKSGDTLININFLGHAECGDILIDYGKLLSEDIKFLQQNYIDMVRIYFDEGYDDYKVRDPLSIIPNSKFNKSKDFKSDYFIRTLQCFE